MSVARTIKTAMSEDDFNLWDDGKRPKKAIPAEHPTVKPLKIGGSLTLDKVKIENISLAVRGRRAVKQNKDGVRFIGFEVILRMKEGKDLQGWMPENDYIELRRELFRDGDVNVDNLEY